MAKLNDKVKALLGALNVKPKKKAAKGGGSPSSKNKPSKK